MRTCNKCQNNLHEHAFRKSTGPCRQCEKAWHAQNYLKNKEKILAKNKEWKTKNKSRYAKLGRKATLKRYGLSEADYFALLKKQNNGCAICGRPDPGRKGHDTLLVDHNHRTGKVRGLLCHQHNVLIGMAQDNSELLQAVIKYLADV